MKAFEGSTQFNRKEHRQCFHLQMDSIAKTFEVDMFCRVVFAKVCMDLFCVPLFAWYARDEDPTAGGAFKARELAFPLTTSSWYLNLVPILRAKTPARETNTHLPKFDQTTS